MKVSVKTVKVQFENNRTKYSYKVPLALQTSDSLVVGGSVVVKSPYNGFVTAKISEVSEDTSASATVFIVDVVDFTAWNRAAKAEADLKAIKKKLEARRKGIEERLIYEVLAERDPEMESLLKQLDMLTKND